MTVENDSTREFFHIFSYFVRFEKKEIIINPIKFI